ncbi:MAG: alpha/beta hydrolase [Patescibacteria group bacterium]
MKKKLNTVILVGGGESFKTNEEYINWLEKFTIYSDFKSSWKSELTNICSAFGTKVIRPMMPNDLNAKYLEWELMFNKYVSLIEGDLILIGHSLGGIFLPIYLSRNNLKAKKLFLVAPVYSPSGDFDFVLHGYNPEKIIKNVEYIKIFHSKDDDIVDIKDAKKYHQDLTGSKLSIYEDKWHFLEGGFEELYTDVIQSISDYC